MALEGSLITADALPGQQASARFITQDLGADYLSGLKGNQDGIWERHNSGYQKFSSAEHDTGWLKQHGHPGRWRLEHVRLSPEEAGLCGCWQFLAWWHERQERHTGQVVASSEE